MPAAVGVHAGERARVTEPAFRLLELGGRTVRWKVPPHGLPATITYAFLTAPRQFPGARNCDAMLPPEAALRRSQIDLSAFRHEVRAAFSLWEAAANVVFKEAPASEAGILIGADAKARGRAFTNVTLQEGSGNAMGAIAQSLICLNPNKPWKIGFDGDLDVYDLRFTMAHEIGHAIGLDHTGPEGQLMSFRYVEKDRGLTPGDIAGVLALYGHKGMKPPSQPGRNATPLPASGPRGQTFGLGETQR